MKTKLNLLCALAAMCCLGACNTTTQTEMGVREMLRNESAPTVGTVEDVVGPDGTVSSVVVRRSAGMNPSVAARAAKSEAFNNSFYGN